MCTTGRGHLYNALQMGWSGNNAGCSWQVSTVAARSQRPAPGSARGGVPVSRGKLLPQSLSKTFKRLTPELREKFWEMRSLTHC